MTNKSLAVRTQEKFDDPKTIEHVFNHIANGGDLPDLCITWDVRYADIMRWVMSDNKRRESYNKAIQSQADFTQARILQELRAVAFFDVREIFNEDGTLKHPTEWPKNAAQVIAGIDTSDLWDYVEDEDGTSGKRKEKVGLARKIKLNDKLKALEMLGKNLRMFTDRIEHGGRITLEDLVNASIKPEAADQTSDNKLEHEKIFSANGGGSGV